MTLYIIEEPIPHMSELERVQDRYKLYWILEQFANGLEQALWFSDGDDSGLIHASCEELFARSSIWPLTPPIPGQCRVPRAINSWLEASSSWHGAGVIAAAAPDDDCGPMVTVDEIERAFADLPQAFDRLTAATLDLAACVATTAGLARDKARLSEPGLAAHFEAVRRRCACLLPSEYVPPSAPRSSSSSGSTPRLAKRGRSS